MPTATTTILDSPWISRIQLMMIVLLLGMQTVDLFVLPMPNSQRWRGDETWLMTEYREQITTGIARYPQALASTVEHDKGVVLGNSWVAAVTYGLPSLMVPRFPRILVGRVITFLLGLLLLLVTYRLARSMAMPIYIALSIILLLIGSDAWLFASHSVRPDLFAGLMLFAAVAYFSREDRMDSWSASSYFAFGALFTFLAVAISVHLITFLGPYALFILYERRRSLNLAKLAAAIGGVAVVVVSLTGITYLLTGHLSLFNESPHLSQYANEALRVPILRPFSRSVQVSNLSAKFGILWREAPTVISVGLITIVVSFMRRRTTPAFTPIARHIIVASSLLFVCWFFLEAESVNYTLHILPLVLLIIAIIAYPSMPWAFVILAICNFAFSSSHVPKIDGFSRELTNSSEQSISILRDSLLSDARKSGTKRPLVLLESPVQASLLEDTAIRPMTDHFVQYPATTQSPAQVLDSLGVNYVFLYNSPLYPFNRATRDPLYQTVTERGRMVGRQIGLISDIGRPLVPLANRPPDRTPDTLTLYRLR